MNLLDSRPKKCHGNGSNMPPENSDDRVNNNYKFAVVEQGSSLARQPHLSGVIPYGFMMNKKDAA